MQIKKEEIRKKLLRSACQEFLIHGYAEASLRVITEKEGLSKGVIYSYFSTKDNLFVTLVTPAIQFIQQSFSDYSTKLHSQTTNPADFSLETNLLDFKEFAQQVLALREEFNLLLFCAAGSSLENYKEDLIQLYSQNFYQHLPYFIPKPTSRYPIHEMFVHTLAATYVQMVSEIVLHNPTPQELDIYAEQMAVFVLSGISQLFSHHF